MPTQNTKEQQFTENESLPALFVDAIRVAKRQDGILFVQFGTVMPTGPKEQARIMVPESFSNTMIEILCQICDYYPQKPKTTTKNPSTKGSE